MIIWTEHHQIYMFEANYIYVIDVQFAQLEGAPCMKKTKKKKKENGLGREFQSVDTLKGMIKSSDQFKAMCEERRKNKYILQTYGE